MIIELYGLPGTGKSTIATKLEYLLRGRIVRIERRKDFICFNLLSFLRHPIKFFNRTVRAFYESGNKSLLYYKFIKIFLYRNAVVEKAKRYPVAIVDEGHLGNILSAFEQPISPEMLIKEIKNLEIPDIVVHFTLPEAERQIRLKNRGFVPRDSESEDYHRRWIKAMLANDQLLAMLLPTLPIQYIHVEQHMTVDELYILLQEKLQAAENASNNHL
ncbi:hypothetical protein HCG51_29050 [Tolypothrix sp. PCC 7910]|uniref:hypothetical protein n=1 Tax=Tolypothrix sp. PCC 7910 TaxID=2099387 RepID=UPI0014278AC1|nr:hypothetical protein [Tolypothrix sp. PCC 7910]QIR40361.1 hypothetical protein HCG51_29050 [Tolypothrix sp. PCC 7910]